MDLCNASLSGSYELFPRGALERAAETSSCILHHEAVRKAVSLDMPPKKPVKRLQFSHGPGSWSFRTASGKGTSA